MRRCCCCCCTTTDARRAWICSELIQLTRRPRSRCRRRRCRASSSSTSSNEAQNSSTNACNIVHWYFQSRTREQHAARTSGHARPPNAIRHGDTTGSSTGKFVLHVQFTRIVSLSVSAEICVLVCRVCDEQTRKCWLKVSKKCPSDMAFFHNRN